jgi:cell division initiation protein
MIDLTPLDIRNKRHDFRKGMRGYETQEVDSFLELAAERLEELVRENLQLRERTQALEAQVRSQSEREAAVRDALVTAQELRTEIREQARQEADKVVEDARTESRRMIAEAEAEVRIRLRGSERKADEIERSLGELERGRLRFLRSFRQLLQREMDVVEVEEARTPLDDRSFEFDLGAIRAEVEGGGVDDEVLSEDGTLDAPSADEVRDQQAHEADDLLPSALNERDELTDHEPLTAAGRAENHLPYLDEEDDGEGRSA